MKRFDELNEREEKSKKQLQIRKIFSKRNICIALICIVVAIALAFVWANLYETHQRKRIENWQQESAANQNNYTISWDWGNTTTETVDSLGDSESNYEDLEIEFAGAEHYGGGLKLYLNINNPNEETVTIETTGVYLNNVCIDDVGYIDSIIGNQESFVGEIVDFSDINATQIGDEITDITIIYRFQSEFDKIREAKDEGFSYKIGDISVNRDN